MDLLLLVSLSRYLDDRDVQGALRLKNAQGQRRATVGDPKQPTKALQRRPQPTLNSTQEINAILHTGLFRSVDPLQKVRPECSQSPQGYRQSADPQPITYRQTQQPFEQYRQGSAQLPQGFGQAPQGFRQFPHDYQQFSQGLRHPAPPTRQFSQPTEISNQNYKIFHRGHVSQGYRQPSQSFGQAPAQNFGQSPDGYPQLSSLAYGHEPASPFKKGLQTRASYPEYRQATTRRGDPASAEPRWKRPTSNDNTLIISYRSPRGRFLRQTNVLLGALLGVAGLLYFFFLR